MKRLVLILAASAALVAGVTVATARTTGRPGVVGVKFSCLERSQQGFVVTEIDRGTTGAAVLDTSTVPSTCVVPPDRAASLPKCGVDGASFSAGCVLTAVTGKQFGSSTATISIINPDSMRPEDLVGANPTPHP